MNSSSRTKPLIGDAMEFIKDVKVVFQDRKEKFNEFMKLLHDFRAKRIDRRVVKEGVTELFKGHQDLISRFNIFLPPGDEIPLLFFLPPGYEFPLLFPMSFATAVKVAFHDKMEKYDEFLKLVVDYNAKRIDMRVFKEGMMELFKDHKDLLLGLNTWLPEGHEISLPLDGDEQQGDGSALKDESALADATKSFATAVKVAFQDKMEKYDEFLKLVDDCRFKRIDMRVFKEGMMELFKDHKDLLLGLNTWLPEGHKISLPLEGDEEQGEDGLELKDAEQQGDGVEYKDELQVDEVALKDEQKDDEQ